MTAFGVAEGLLTINRLQITVRLMGLTIAMLQLFEMQKMLRKVVEDMAVESSNPLVAPCDRVESVKAMSAATEAWEKLEERKRIMRGRPLPGTLKHIEYKPRGIRGLSRIEDVQDEDIPEPLTLTEGAVKS